LSEDEERIWWRMWLRVWVRETLPRSVAAEVGWRHMALASAGTPVRIARGLEPDSGWEPGGSGGGGGED